MKVVNVLDLPQGQDFFLRQDNRSDLYLYTVQDGVAKLFKSANTLGKWDVVDYQSQEFNTFEKDLTGLRGNEVGDTSVLVYKHGSSMSILQMPQTTASYVYDNAYRLYWAVDSRKLYMNICDNWEMIGTLRHDLLDNIGTLTHDEIETKLTAIENALSSIGAAFKSLNGMNGDVTIEAGSNVLVTTDTDNKKIRISSSGGGGGATELPIVTTLPTDVLDGHTCLLDAGANGVYQCTKFNNNWYRTALAPMRTNKILLPDTFEQWTTTATGVGTVNATPNEGYVMAYKLPGNGVASANVTTTGVITGNKAGPGTMYIGCDSEANYDKLTVTLNGTDLTTISGPTKVATVACNFVVGDNTVVLKYTKEGSGNTGADCGYLYAIDMPWTY